MTRALPCLVLSACIPVLTSPGSDDSGSGGGVWAAPENSWINTAPPASLEGEGWGEGEVVPDARFVDQNGDEVALWQFYGQVIALDVSTIWCAPCRELAAHVDETWLDYVDQDFMYLTLLGEDTQGDIPDVDELVTWASDYGITAPVLSDPDQHVYDIVPDGTYPRVVIINRELVVVEDQVNPVDDATIRSAIEAAL
jgi:thiol-disulfide isomerase/thioredoxin